MKQKQHSTEESIRILRQAGGDDTVDAICREHNISSAACHRLCCMNPPQPVAF